MGAAYSVSALAGHPVAERREVARGPSAGDVYVARFVAERRPRTPWSALAAMTGVCEADLRRWYDAEYALPGGAAIFAVAAAAAPPPAPEPPRRAPRKLAAAFYGADGARVAVKKGGRKHVLLSLVNGRRGFYALAETMDLSVVATGVHLWDLRRLGFVEPGDRAAPPRLTASGRLELERLDA